MLKVGVFGAGHLGKIHLKLLKQIPFYEVTGFYDPDDENAEKVALEFGVPRFTNPAQLLQQTQVADIVTPTVHHFETARLALAHGNHIFVEKPLAGTIAEAAEMVQLARNAGVKAQVGHVERFNPAFLAIKSQPLQPKFIETHRLAQFNPRGTDVSVVLDLMIHDIDILLTLVKDEVTEVRASGVAVVSASPDIANARIEFAGGCVANLTASRLSLKNMRKTRIFQPSAYISIDFLEKQTEIVTIANEANPNIPSFEIYSHATQTPRFLLFNRPQPETVNAIQMELTLFAESILQNKPEEVPIEDGLRSMQLAYRIMEEIEKHQN
ncbi:gfo/Idh/MocA family oxidoreductase [Sphingobacteriales bacterium UPWRP_1]|nr:oxidoreductase [Sphingobacteriales bacterium TSM_CSS]PSJ77665.1 gfo/Idh/MocA family oxidoreductase [Sphingobacteriales bacterium UPWRP_1]